MSLLNSYDKITIINTLGLCHSLLGSLLLPPFSEGKKNKE